MKQAKATKKDIRCLTDFFLMLDEVVKYGTYTPPNDEEEEISEQVDDARLCELIREAWGTRGPGVDTSWRRVVMGMDVLIDQCCDPDLDYLEWRPDVRKFLENQGGEDVSFEQKTR